MSQKRSRAAFESVDGGPPPHAPYAVYGTPLPPYDPEARDDGSYVPIWKQEVTDERGRKRLHGAFTGGWSAGYFNTVGSKEGWTPASFVSSRSNRAKVQDGGQKAEDFMDEEDLAQQAESQKIETQGDFAGLGSSDSAGQRVKGMFADLFRATGDTIGVKLLQRMGWRQGQGIGPKVRRAVKGDTKGETHLFAPEDSKMITFNRKTDRKGLGFLGEGKLQDDREIGNDDENDEDDNDARILQSSRSKAATQPKKIKKTGIGIGVLNDTGSDDENEYDMGPKISYNRVIGGDKKKRKGGLIASNASTTVQKPSLTSKKLAQRTLTLSGFRKCQDGRLPIDGFVLSLAPLSLVQENKYPPPEPPAGWKPTGLTLTFSDEKTTPYQSTSDAAKTSTLDPKTRAALLGEQQLPGKSVFDFMSPAARERLASASGKTNLPPALGERAPADYKPSESEPRKTLWDLVPPLDPRAAAAALQRGQTGWMPYAEDLDKRGRYRSFLALRAGQTTDLPPRPKGFSIDEWAKEMREFAQAAEVFKPISGLMATRFTTSSSVSSPQLASDAYVPDSSAAAAGREEDPAEKAAKMGMYGALTRSRQAFFPTRLLCKRFGVRPPANVTVDPGGVDGEGGATALVDESRRLDVVSQASLDQMMNFRPAVGTSFVSGGTEGGESEKDTSSMLRQQTGPSIVDVETNEALDGPRAGEDVFKDVFGDDDD